MKHKKFNLPDYRILFDSTDRVEQSILIKTLQAMGINVSVNAVSFTEEFPRLAWSPTYNSVTCTNQTIDSPGNKTRIARNMKEFLQHFVDTRSTIININSEFTAEVSMYGVNVIKNYSEKETELSDSTVKEIYEKMVAAQENNVSKNEKGYPTVRIVLRDTDKQTVDRVISILKSLKIPISSITEEFDVQYPYLFWNQKSNQISQTRTLADSKIFKSATDFIFQFLPETNALDVKVSEINGYECSIKADGTYITIGCTKVTFEKVEEIYKELIALQK